MTRHGRQFIGRRQFFKRASLSLAAVPALGVGLGGLLSCSSDGASASRASASGSPSEPDPKSLSWRTKVVSDAEPGEPLVVEGRIFDADGKTPLEGVVLYFYHTDARGIYSDADGSGGPPNPRLKGWLKTDAQGRYEFATIKPASYPNSRNPAHIHAKTSGAGRAEQWIEEFWFDGDPHIGAASLERAKAEGRFSPVMTIRRDAAGVLRCTRDIRLKPA